MTVFLFLWEFLPCVRCGCWHGVSAAVLQKEYFALVIFLQMREMKTPIYAESYLSSCSVVAKLVFELGWLHMKIKPLSLKMNQLKSQGHLPHHFQILEPRASAFVTSVLCMTRRSTIKSRLWSLPFWGHPAYCHSTTCSNSQTHNTHTFMLWFPLTTDDGPRLCPSWPLISLMWIPQSSRTAPLMPAGTRYMLSSLHLYSPFPTSWPAFFLPELQV